MDDSNETGNRGFFESATKIFTDSMRLGARSATRAVRGGWKFAGHFFSLEPVKASRTALQTGSAIANDCLESAKDFGQNVGQVVSSVTEVR